MEWHKNCYCAGEDKANLVVPGLYVGSWFAASSKKWLTDNNIKSILTIAEYPLEDVSDDIDHMQIIMDDNGTLCNNTGTYSDVLQECLTFLQRAINDGENVLVHCVCGMNRSVNTVIAYLMLVQNMSYDEAKEFVYGKRRIASPSKLIRRMIEDYFERKINVETNL
jgi:atypical dual specificity phosphatase